MAFHVQEEGCGYIIQTVDKIRGRGLIATKDFSKGETIFREKPLVSCQYAWNEAYSYKACHNCMEPLETAQENVTRLSGNPNILIPHQECCTTRSAFHVSCPKCQVKYCSKDCLEEAWDTFHKTLCMEDNLEHPLLAALDMWKSFHHPPETTNIMLFMRILASIAQAEHGKREEVLQKYTNMIHDVIDHKDNYCHKLLGEHFSTQREVMWDMVKKFYESEPSVGWFLTPDGFMSLLALVGRNGQGVGTSPLSQWVKTVEKMKLKKEDKDELDKLIDKIYAAIEEHAGEFLNNEGTGLYSLQSIINHSCDPNAIVEFPFNNHELVVNAIKPINAGEEILISYLGECEVERSRHSRQKYLMENYMFECWCAKCRLQQNDPDVTSEEEMSDDSAEDD